jgi:NAD(P)-dependent dehydrogenase (short-subunit alcohol dehydrogenase family)
MLVILSAGSWTAHPAMGNYAVSKAAAWGLTNNLRATLAPQGVTVSALHAGFIGTDMARNFPVSNCPLRRLSTRRFAGSRRDRPKFW